MNRERIICPIYQGAQKYPQRTAYLQKQTTITYEQANSHIAHIQDKCESFGINSETSAAVIASNSIEYILLIFALNRINAAIIPLNVRWSPLEWRGAMQQANVSILISDNNFISVMDIPNIQNIPMSELLVPNHVSTDNSVRTPRIDFHCVSSILFTSGSTGKPKGVMLTNGNHYYNAMASNRNIPLNQQHCWLLSLPLYHVGGMAILYRAALAGATVAVVSSFAPDEQLETIQMHNITHISCVPAMLHRLIHVNNRQPFPASLQHILLGGGPVASHLIEEIQSLSLPVRTTYGMTETASQVTCLKPDSKSKLHTAGQSLHYSEIRILDTNGKSVPVNTEGEIAVKGNIVSPGYITQSNEEIKPPQEWFRSGDIGYVDADGYLVVQGRQDDMLISGGENIYPSEIEHAVLLFHGILDCKVLAVDDVKWGKRPVLFVETVQGPEFNTEKLHAFLKQYLPKLKMPDLIISLQSIPRTSTGKIDSNALHKIYAQLNIPGS